MMETLTQLSRQPGLLAACWHSGSSTWVSRGGAAPELETDRQNAWKAAADCFTVLRLHGANPTTATWHLDGGILALTCLPSANVGLLAAPTTPPDQITHWLETLAAELHRGHA